MNETTPRTRIVISGASGLIGSALAASLRADGCAVTRLVRRAPQSAEEVQWYPGERALDPGVLDGAHAVVALGGTSVGKMPWTRKRKHELSTSRLGPTRTIAEAMRQLASNPHRNAPMPAFISASAVGFYGTAPGRVLNETSAAGDTFLARLCVEWEDVARAAETHTRVVLLRTAPVIHPNGVLKPLMRLTRLGLGGRIGSGSQVWPWVSFADEVRAIRHLIDREISGPVNLVGPQAATAKMQGSELARAMRRPFLVPAPAWALRLALGRDAAESLLLSDADVHPEVLLASGFTFAHPTVAEAIAAVLPAKWACVWLCARCERGAARGVWRALRVALCGMHRTAPSIDPLHPSNPSQMVVSTDAKGPFKTY